LAIVMMIPMLLMRRFVPFFGRHETVASYEGSSGKS